MADIGKGITVEMILDTTGRAGDIKCDAGHGRRVTVFAHIFQLLYTLL